MAFGELSLRVARWLLVLLSIVAALVAVASFAPQAHLIVEGAATPIARGPRHLEPITPKKRSKVNPPVCIDCADDET
ncbi:hypothetical protein HDU93_001900, partial [Gonapodya sp. JEL0774]